MLHYADYGNGSQTISQQPTARTYY